MHDPPAFEIVTPRGSLRGWFPSRTRMLTQLIGEFQVDHARGWGRITDAWVARERVGLISFNDWELASGYETEARVIAVETARRNSPGYGITHILVGNPVLAMGVRVAGFVLGAQLIAHTTRTAFVDAARANGVIVPDLQPPHA